MDENRTLMQSKLSHIPTEQTEKNRCVIVQLKYISVSTNT